MSKKYLIISVDWREILISLVIGCGVGFLTKRLSSPDLFATITIGFLSSIIIYIIINSLHFFSKMKKASQHEINKNLSLAIDKILHDVEEKDKETREKTLDYSSHHLKLINGELQRSSLEFQPDIDPVNILHKVNGTISITEKIPREWLDPTYNFFLIKSYISSLRHRVNSHTGSRTMEFLKNREEQVFTDFKNRKKEI